MFCASFALSDANLAQSPDKFGVVDFHNHCAMVFVIRDLENVVDFCAGLLGPIVEFHKMRQSVETHYYLDVFFGKFLILPLGENCLVVFKICERLLLLSHFFVKILMALVAFISRGFFVFIVVVVFVFIEVFKLRRF